MHFAYCNIHVRPNCADFHETHKCSTELHADSLGRISPEADSKCRQYG